MSTVTSAVTSSLRDVSKANESATRLGQQLITGKKVATAQDDPSAWLESSRAQSTASYLDAIHTGLNELATNINVADTAMQAIGQLVATMQGQIQEAQLYPAGDPVRQQLIISTNQTRQQIDDLVNTSTQTGARNLMSDPAADPQAGNIHALVGLNGEVKIVHAQQVDTGPEGLNISNLPAKASDAQLQNALQALQSAQATLATRRNGLSADAADIARYTAQSSSISSFYQAEAESLTAVDETQAAVELQSVSTQQSLAMQALGSISTSRNAILELLQ
jgi:flagellin-like hook-associated protein FlgL